MVMEIKNDIMIDLEFLSQSSDASVIQIAAVRFGSEVGADDAKIKFNRYINKINGSVDMSTLLFWMENIKNSSYMDDYINNKGINTRQALVDFQFWLCYRTFERIWCKGTLDFPILTNLYRKYDIELPWGYWKENEMRTVLHVAEVDNPNGGHDALADCRIQIESLENALTKLRR